MEMQGTQMSYISSELVGCPQDILLELSKSLSLIKDSLDHEITLYPSGAGKVPRMGEIE